MKQISNPISTGGGGISFENEVQASFLLMMLLGGNLSCFPECQIKKIQLQGLYAGYNTDDLIIFVENRYSGQERKLLGQIKLTVSVTKSDKQFIETIRAAWNDYTSGIFNQDKDALVLLTGPMSVTDTKNVRPILEYARHSEDYNDFHNKINSKKKSGKLKVFRNVIEDVNGKSISDEEFFMFLRHFYIWGFDLDAKTGTLLSLIHTVIGVFDTERAEMCWSYLIREVSNFNKNSGIINIDNISSDILNVFSKTSAPAIPEEYIPNQGMEQLKELNSLRYSGDIALMNLIGCFDENNNFDIQFVSQIIGKEYDVWIENIRETLHTTSKPLEYKNGIWKVKERKTFWKALGQRLYDEQLKSFTTAAVEALIFIDETSNNKFLYNRIDYSSQLKKSIAESLALIGNHRDEIEHCSEDQIKRTLNGVLHEILSYDDINIWKSINYFLPDIAEAAPDLYMKIVNDILEKPDNPITQLYSIKGDSITGRDYMAGFFWALEILAWSPDNIYWVCHILTVLPNSNSDEIPSGSAINTLISIFLPWHPQTLASVDFRKSILTSLKPEAPNTVWELLLKILPRPGQISMGNTKPKWRNYIPQEWDYKVANIEYNDFISFTIDLIINLAENDIHRTKVLIESLDQFPKYTMRKIVDFLYSSSLKINTYSDKRIIWEMLINFINNHRRFSDAKWALDAETVDKIENIARKIAPENPIDLYARLFTQKEFNLYLANENWEKQHLKLEDRRLKAVKKIMLYGGYDSILDLVSKVDSPYLVGYSLGKLEAIDIDDYFFPSLFNSENTRYADLVRGYIWKSSFVKGWEWVDKLDKEKWSVVQIAKFLSCLPFVQKTWNRAHKWLGNKEREYWNRAWVDPFATNDNLIPAIKALIKYGRADASIACVHKMIDKNEDVDPKLVIKALLEASKTTQIKDQMEAYYLEKIIRYIQNEQGVHRDDITKVEWAYLPLLRHSNTDSPKFLETHIAADPDFFCDLIKTAYGSRKNVASDKTIYVEYDNKVNLSIQLLNTWKTVPGMNPNGSFSKTKFSSWIDSVEDSFKGSKLLKRVYYILGEVFVHSPSDPDGLWIDHQIAKKLDAAEADDIRSAYSTKVYNSRGVNSFDPSGAQEIELAKKYQNQAKKLEEEGYFRFARELKNLAKKYKDEAKKK